MIESFEAIIKQAILSFVVTATQTERQIFRREFCKLHLVEVGGRGGDGASHRKRTVNFKRQIGDAIARAF